MPSHPPARTLILGAGISGLATALALSEASDQGYAIYEQSSAAGGLCQITERDGFRLEKVTHVLHFRSAHVQAAVEGLLDGNLDRIERSAWIYFSKRYVPYPFQTHLGFLPLAEKIYCMAHFWGPWIANKFNGTRDSQNFEEWVHAHFGRGIGKHFMIPYNTKLWGIAPHEMSTDWVKRFVPRTSLRKVMLGFLLKRSREIGYNAYFSYPRWYGVQALVDALEARVRPIIFNKKAIEIDLSQKTVLFEDGEGVQFNRLVSTIPLKTFVLRAKGVPDALRLAAENLRATSLLNITYCLRKPLPHAHHWVYFPEPEYPFFRLVFPSNISSSLAPDNCSIISAEISNPAAHLRSELETRTLQHLMDLGYVKDPSDIVLIQSAYLDHAYPVHDLGREARVAGMLEFLKSKGVWSIGRFGAWRYSSIDDAIVEGLKAAQEIHQSSTPAATTVTD